MSQPIYPRKFKFVGGPSRKRRRHAVPSRDPVLPKPVSVVKVTNNNQRPVQLDDATNPDLLRSLDVDDVGSITISAAYEYNNATNTTDDIPSPIHEAQSSANFEDPRPLEVFESMVDWPASTDLSLTKDHPTSLQFEDLFTVLNSPFNVDSSSYQPCEEPSGNPDHFQHGDHELLNISDVLTNGSSTSTESIRSGSEFDARTHLPIPTSVCQNLGEIFNQYDQEFCVWPLTHDFKANPFRHDLDTGRGSPLLWHSILALSYKHINRETGACLAEARVHKRKAVQLFKEQETHIRTIKDWAELLDGLLILTTLDCATSAQGPWYLHLSRAQKIIEALCVGKVFRTPKVQAQIDMFVWWDVTLCLTTRQGFILSQPIISSVLSKKNSSVFYNISGCPEELFRYMVRLAAYAREFELASHMTCVTFDMGPVLAVGKAIEEWRVPQYDESDVELALSNAGALFENWSLDPVKTAHYIQDLYHCAQAWQLALLLYIERVFKWRRHEASMARISLLARKTLNNVFSCRRSVMIQKQLLLPVFLAASETDDEKMREDSRSYCSWWRKKTRYDMFITALALLEEVWTATEDSEAWWGSVIDRKSEIGSTKQYLFG